MRYIEDGFFLGREVRPFWLKLSAILRWLRVGDYVHWLPGVRRDPGNDMHLLINTQIARILPLQIFHLLGFRKVRWSGKYLVVSRRRYDMFGPRQFKIVEVGLNCGDNKFERDRTAIISTNTYGGETSKGESHALIRVETTLIGSAS